VPPFAVTKDYIPATDIEEHRRADLAGERTVLLGVEVLRTKRDVTTFENFADKSQIGERRANRDYDLLLRSGAINNRLGQARSVSGGGVHLPVADDEFLAQIY
jgi:hypothetical protein